MAGKAEVIASTKPISLSEKTDLIPLCNERGGVLSLLVVLLAVLGVAVVLIFYVFGQVVLPNEVGIRRNYISVPGVLEGGFESEGLLPGLHWKLPWISTVQTIPRNFQFIHLNDSETDGELNLEQMMIPTTDGSKVETDLTLIVRYLEEPGPGKSVDESEAVKGPDTGERIVPVQVPMLQKHGGPADLISLYTFDQDQQLQLFMKTAADSIIDRLSTLSTTEYYDPVLRESAALSAAKEINQQVNPNGVELWANLIRRYVYAEKKIDDQIFAKNLQEQTERLNAAKRGLEEAKAITRDKLAEWDAKIRDVEVKSEQDKRVIESEADRYEVEQRSRGDLLVAEASAAVDQAKNTVLAETPGADIFVAREMTPLLSTLEGGVVSNIDPFNVDGWVKKLVPEVR